MKLDLAKKAGKGVAWNLASQTIQQAIQFIVIIILAILLEPSEFGIFSMAIIFANFIYPFRQWGFQAFLIQKKDTSREYEDTAFWSIAVMGLILFILSLILAPFASIFFNNAKVGKLVSVIAIGFLFRPFGAVQWALASRELNFKAIATRNKYTEDVIDAVKEIAMCR